VRRSASGLGRFELVAGERRWRAARLAGLDAVPAIVAELGDEQAAEWALIENVQREELGAMERAIALRSLLELFGLTHAEAADRVGLDRSSVSNLVRLTDLEEPIRAQLEAGKLGVGHGKALLAAPAGPGRIGLAKRAAEGGWSVRRLERAAAAAAQAGPSGAVGAAGADDEERRLASKAQELGRGELERQLGEHLGTKVHVRTGRGGSRGRLIVEFYDLDQFDGLMARIGFQIK
jgi:ParB family transcriptional regulator, chromosome partitioning protein